MTKAKGYFSNAAFCPFCGTEAIDRDRYGEERTPPKFAPEFICRACGKGFRILPSLRYITAAQLATEHRKLRPPDELPKHKPVPDDVELNNLTKYGEKIGHKNEIRRTGQDAFGFYRDGTCVGKLTYEKAMGFLRGYEMGGLDWV